MSHPVCLWSPKSVAFPCLHVILFVRNFLAAVHCLLHEVLSVCLSSGKRQVRSNIFQKVFFFFFTGLLEFSFDGHHHHLNPKTHPATLLPWEKKSGVILIVVLPHVSYEMFSVLCVLLLDVCLVGHTGLCFLMLLFVGHICALYLVSLTFLLYFTMYFSWKYLQFSSSNAYVVNMFFWVYCL